MAPGAEEQEKAVVIGVEMEGPAQQQQGAAIADGGVSDDEQGQAVAITTTTTTTKRPLARAPEEQGQGQDEGGGKRARGGEEGAGAGAGAVLRAAATVVVVVDDDDEDEDEDRNDDGPGTAATTFTAMMIPTQYPPPAAAATPIHPRLQPLLRALLGLGPAAPLPLPLPPAGGSSSHRLPRLFVVDLDYTLWRGNVSDHSPPFEPTAHADRVLCRRRPASTTRSFFSSGRPSNNSSEQQQQAQDNTTAVHFGLFREARAVLKALHSLGVPLAIASRAPDRHAAETVLGLLGMRGWFAYAQIYHDATKKTHLGAILRASGFPPHSVLFFDDEPRNIKDVRALGCSACLVQRDEGLSWRALEEGLKQFKQEGASRGLMASYFSAAGKGGDAAGGSGKKGAAAATTTKKP